MRYTKLKKKIFIDTNYENKDNELNMSIIL